MRTFIGVPLDEKLKDEITPIQDELSKYMQTRLVEPKKLHWTVKFLGNIDYSQKEAITDVLEALKRSLNPFPIHVSGVGAFPNVKRPKIIWIGENSNGLFEELMSETEEMVTERGFQKNDHDPTPHLTIGRVKRITDMGGLRKMLSRHENTHFGDMKVEELVLYRSTPTDDGHVYDALYRVNLGE